MRGYGIWYRFVLTYYFLIVFMFKLLLILLLLSLFSVYYYLLILLLRRLYNNYWPLLLTTIINVLLLLLPTGRHAAMYVRDHAYGIPATGHAFKPADFGTRCTRKEHFSHDQIDI